MMSQSTMNEIVTKKEKEEIFEVKNSEEIEKNIEKNNRKVIKKFFLIVFVLCLIGASFWVGLERGKAENISKNESSLPLNQTTIVNKDRADNVLDFSLFWKVWDLLKQKYVDEGTLDSKKLMYGAIQGMMQATISSVNRVA